MKTHQLFLSVVVLLFWATGCRSKPAPAKSVEVRKKINLDATFINAEQEWRKNENLRIEDVIYRLGSYSWFQTIDGFTSYVWDSDGRIVFFATTKLDSSNVTSVSCSEHY